MNDPHVSAASLRVGDRILYRDVASKVVAIQSTPDGAGYRVKAQRINCDSYVFARTEAVRLLERETVPDESTEPSTIGKAGRIVAPDSFTDREAA